MRFFLIRREKFENLGFLGKIFQTQTQTIETKDGPTRATKNWSDSGEKFLIQTHHYWLIGE